MAVDDAWHGEWLAWRVDDAWHGSGRFSAGMASGSSSSLASSMGNSITEETTLRQVWEQPGPLGFILGTQNIFSALRPPMYQPMPFVPLVVAPRPKAAASAKAPDGPSALRPKRQRLSARLMPSLQKEKAVKEWRRSATCQPRLARGRMPLDAT